MKIACLAWGSLLWKWQPLPVVSEWRPGGPLLPLEFTRVGDKAELSPALCPGADVMPTWWALLSVGSVHEGRELLRQREEIAVERSEWVGSAPGDALLVGAVDIEAWRLHHGLDAVVWTALPPRYRGQEGRVPTAEEAVDYLSVLDGKQREHARDYIARVPHEFRTRYRVLIEERLGWVARADAVDRRPTSPSAKVGMASCGAS